MTLHIDLRQTFAADAHLETAAELAEQTGHREIAAWCLETKAWDVLTSGDFRRALELSRHARAVAPSGGSAIVQATAQEGRAWARLGDRKETGKALAPVERLAEQRTPPEHPEHHYRYDPAKAHSYAATTVAWAGDPAAASVARDVIAELEQEGARPRRIASARLDVGLALLAAVAFVNPPATGGTIRLPSISADGGGEVPCGVTACAGSRRRYDAHDDQGEGCRDHPVSVGRSASWC